jgi:hypothetical protein
MAAGLKPEPAPEPTAAMPRTSLERRPAPAPTSPRREPPRHEPPRREPPSPLAAPRRARGPLVPLLALLALAVVGGVLAFALLGGGDDGKGGDSSSTSAAERQQRAERRRARREKAARQREQAQQPATPAAPAPQPDTGGSDSNYEIPQPSGDSVAEGSRLQLQGHEMIDSDPEGAVKVLERSVKAFPAGTDDIHLQYAYFSLGKALRLSDRPEDAIPVLELRLKNPDQRSTVEAELERARADAAG